MSGQHLPLTDSQVCTIVNALRVAAEQYAHDAMDNSTLHSQFMRQKGQAEVLADLLEGSDVVVTL
jgi:hypothetical protein